MYEIHKQLKTPVVVYELSFLSKHFCMFVIIMRCKAACVVKSGSNRGVKYTDPHILGQPQEWGLGVTGICYHPFVCTILLQTCYIYVSKQCYLLEL